MGDTLGGMAAGGGGDGGSMAEKSAESGGLLTLSRAQRAADVAVAVTERHGTELVVGLRFVGFELRSAKIVGLRFVV